LTASWTTTIALEFPRCSKKKNISKYMETEVTCSMLTTTEIAGNSNFFGALFVHP
jgi:hypothetical protein